MAKKQLKKIRDSLFSNEVVEFEELENRFQVAIKTTMVDPEVVESGMKQISSVSTYIQNLNSTLFLAIENSEKFISTFNSQCLMYSSILKTVKQIEKEQPELEDLINSYYLKIDEILPLVEICKWVKRVKDLPNSKKKLKRCKEIAKNLKFFLPLVRLRGRIKLLRDFIEKELD